MPGGPARGLTIYYGPDIDMKRRGYAGVGSSPGFVLGDIYICPAPVDELYPRSCPVDHLS